MCQKDQPLHTDATANIIMNNNNDNDDDKTMKICASYPQVQKYQEELDRQREMQGPDSPELVKTLSTLGLVHQHMTKDVTEALKYHEEARRILKQQLARLPRNDPSVDGWIERLAVTQTDLAFIHEKAGDFETAKEEYSEAHALLVSVDCDHKLILLTSCTRGFERTNRAPSQRNLVQNPSA